MIIIKRTLIVFLTFILVITLIVGCDNHYNKNMQIEDANIGSDTSTINKDVVVAFDSTFISLDPHDTNDNHSYSVQKTIMQGLLEFDKEMNIIPVLAESYEYNDEATEYIFKLRKGIKFHDGTDFNAEAVKINIDRLANPQNRLRRNSLFSMVKKTEIIDDFTMKVTLKNPFGAMINNFAHPAAAIHSPAALKKYGKDVSRNPVGTGPYKFKEWVPGVHIIVEKNENYWKDGYPKLDRITFIPVVENGARIAMLQTGEADLIYPFPTEQSMLIKGRRDLTLEDSTSISVEYISMNCLKKPFDDVRVRKAMNYAIDKKTYNKILYNGFSKEMDSVIAENTQFYVKQEPYEYNIEKAKSLLKEAGYENGFKVELWGPTHSVRLRGMEYLQQQLAQLNIELRTISMESGIRHEKVWSAQNPEAAEVEMYYTSWSPSTGDADWGIRPLFSTDSFPPSAFNSAYYSNKAVDALLEEGLKTSNLNIRAGSYKEVQKIIWNEAPWIFLVIEPNLVGRKSNLKGMYIMPDGILSSKDAEIIVDDH